MGIGCTGLSEELILQYSIMRKFFLFTIVVLVLLTSAAFGGTRGPGKYAGVVIFDRWNTCYLYSGTYLMYIAEDQKEKLRRYAGKSILIDARKVYQPVNPGDGLITELKYLGKARVKEDLPDVEGLKLTVAIKSENGSSHLKFELSIENQGDKAVEIDTGEIAPTVFGEKASDDPFSPSDGKSEAKITRYNLEYVRRRYGNSFAVILENVDSLPRSFRLDPGEKRQFTIRIDTPPGEYDFLFGYGGGVHDGKGVASNLVSFSAFEKEKTSLIESTDIIPTKGDVVNSLLAYLVPKIILQTF
jgi:hypothetical protein